MKERGIEVFKCVRIYLLLLCGFAIVGQPLRGSALPNPTASSNTALPVPAPRDGQHDFDFEFGAWKTHLSRLEHPLTGSTTWVEYEGISVVRKVWNGRANLVELEADGTAGHIEGLSLRLYDPQARQWSLNFANSKTGTLSQPAVGEFNDGRGEFFDQEPFHGRTILVRGVWKDITPNSCTFEQAFSDDGGKTWEVNWIASETRIKEDPNEIAPTSGEINHDFDFEFGDWNIHLKRLLHPLTGSTSWVEFDGTSVTKKVWGGRAQLEEFETDSAASGHIEGLTLRLFNPKSRQWSLYWANSKNGQLVVPQIGECKGDHGEFYAADTLNDKAIFVRFIWSETNTNKPHFEQAFSEDGGKTWEVNWITDQTHMKDATDSKR
jgi:hypothetical protein